MVRKVKFLSSHATYRELNVLLDTTSLKTIPLVDSKGGIQKIQRFNGPSTRRRVLKLQRIRFSPFTLNGLTSCFAELHCGSEA